MRVPTAHGAAARPAAALRELELGGHIVRALGGNSNIHWLVGGICGAGKGDSGGRAVLRRYGPWRALDEVSYELRSLERVAVLGWPVPHALTTIDFDFTHLDHRAADFVWTWRGKNDDSVRGYEEVMPLTAADRALLAPSYWATVLESTRLELLWKDAPEKPERVSLPGVIEYLHRRSALTLG